MFDSELCCLSPLIYGYIRFGNHELLDFWATLVCTATEQNSGFVGNKQLSLNFLYLYYEFHNILQRKSNKMPQRIEIFISYLYEAQHVSK
jgi:hypothetical protein